MGKCGHTVKAFDVFGDVEADIKGKSDAQLLGIAESVKAEYEKELIIQKEREEALEQEKDGLMLHLKKRFMEKKNFEDYPLAVELFESLNPTLTEKATAELV